MRFCSLAAFGCMSAILVFPGCASAGPSQDELRSTIYATHRIVQNLDTNLSGTVSKLSDTAATLSSRLDATDQELRQLSGMAVDNQRKIDRLQASVDSLTATLYRHFNLSPPQPVATPSFPSATPTPIHGGGVVVQPPSAGVVQRPGTTAPAGPTEILPPLEGATPGATTVTPPPTPVTAPAPVTAAPAVASAGDTELYRAAQQLYAQENYSAAQKQFDEHLKQFPNSPNAANATYWKAHCAFRLNDFPQAILGFEELRAKYPTSDKVPTAMHNQAVAYSRMGQNARAIELFEQLIAEYPDHPATVGAREKLQQLQGQ
jgi:tol-pal system protein YbgF